MPALLPIRFRTELARQFHRTITNTTNVLSEDRNTLTPLDTVLFEYTASASQITFTGVDDNAKTLSYTPGRIEVYVNGGKISSGNYSALNGTSVVFSSPLALNDVVTIIKMNILVYPNPSDYYHVFLGRTTPWYNNVVSTPQDTRSEDSETKRNIIAVKKVQPSDTALLIPRINWTTDTIYSSYLDDENFSSNEFYVMNTSYRIYKCIYSPGTPSVVQPTQTTAGPFNLSDGYYWQLMYEVPAAERIRFLTDDFIPVRFYATSTTFDHNGIVDEIILGTERGSGYVTPPTVLILGDGQGATATASLSGGEISSVTVTNAGQGYTFAVVQFLGGGGSGAVAEASLRSSDLPITVNQDVASYAISAGGGINFIEVVNGGTGYLAATTEIEIKGDGTGAEAAASVVNGVVTSVTITDRGKGYTYVELVVTGAGANASLRAVIEPQGGHGSNLPQELFARVVAISVNIEDVLSDFFLDNDFRQIGLVKNIKNFNETEIFSASTGNACYVVEVPSVNQYSVDDVVLTNTGGEYVVVNKTATTIFLLAIIDSISASSVLNNETTGVGALSITSIDVPEISTKTGDVIYVRNIAPVTRQVGQVEQIKLYFSF